MWRGGNRQRKPWLGGALMVIGVVATCALAWCSPALAAGPYEVTTLSGASGTSGSLPYEISQADSASGGTITFAPGLTGAIDLSSTVTIDEDLTIQGPTPPGSITIDAGSSGSAFEITAGSVSISGLEFTDATDSAIVAIEQEGSGALTITGSTFIDNDSGGSGVSGSGGAIDVEYVAGAVTVTDSTFMDNSAGGAGGATEDTGSGNGGAIYDQGSAALMISGSSFTGNTAGGSGDGETDSAQGYGGAVNLGDQVLSLAISDSTFNGNSAGGAGGAGPYSGAGYGGAVANYSATTEAISDTTFTGNSAGGAAGTGLYSGVGGGGAFSAYYQPATLTSDTIDANSVGAVPGSFGSGIAYADGVTAQDTIVAGNTGASNCDEPVASSSYSVEGPAGQTSCGFDLPSADPMLGSLANNGGSTQTQALPADSPAVDVVPATECPTSVDQRGEPRPGNMLGVCSVGAYEYEGPVPTGTVVVCSPNPVLVGNVSACTATVSHPPSSPPLGTVTLTASGPGATPQSSCTLVAVSGSSSACSVSYAPSAAGSLMITGAYVPSVSDDHAASSGTATLSAVASTTTVLTASANPLTAGSQVTYTATVSPVPNGGAVSFVDTGTIIAGCGSVGIDLSNGTATCQARYDTPGSHAISAGYGGDSAFLASGSATLNETVVSTPTSVPRCTLRVTRSKVLLAKPKAKKGKKSKAKVTVGVVSVSARCDQAATARLSGTITEATHQRGKKQTTRKRFAVHAAGSLKANIAAKLTVKLSAAALSGLKAGHAESVVFTLSAKAKGGVATVKTKAVTLHGEKS